MYGMGYQRVRQMLVDAGITINARGSNGANHPEAWYAAQRDGNAARRAQLDEARRRRWADPAQHQRASDKLRNVWENDPAWRQRHSETLRRMWDDPAKPLARHWDDPAQRERQRQLWLRRIEAARGRDEIPPGEVVLHDALKRASISFTTSVVVLDGLYIVDVLIHQRPLIIEADGVSHRIGDVEQRDAERVAVLEASGYTVVRFSYQQFADDVDGCIASLDLKPEKKPRFIIRTHSQAFGELARERAKRR